MTIKDNFYSGTSGLVLPFPKKDFPAAYADSSRLAFYATLQNSIEINSSFYRLPMASTVLRWVSEAPVNFRFTFKLWKEVTHQKGLAFNPPDVEKFMAVISGAVPKNGCLLVQFPPSLPVGALRQLEHLLQTIREFDAAAVWNVAVEFRHRSWYQQPVYDLLKVYGAALVIQDMPASATPLISVNEAFVYVRFHGPDGNYKGSYSDAFLSEYALYIQEWLAEGKEVYVYFNNTAGDALNNLNFLKRCID
jgi:uncharacterized protein YecE (DUF72 family)